MSTDIVIPNEPKRIENVEIKNSFSSKDNNTQYILKNKNDDVYMLLSPHDYFIWELLDGQHSIEEINLKFYYEYNRISVDHIEKLIKDLGDRGFLGNYEYDPKTLKYKQKLYQIRIPIRNIDRLFKWVYKQIGNLVFSKQAIIFYFVVSVLGWILYTLTPAKPLLLKKNFFNMFLLYCAAFFPVFLHELGHALACLRYGRNVKDAGFMFYMFIPVFYVNTSDIWMSDRKARIITSAAGPLVDVIIGGLSMVIYYLLPQTIYSPLFYQVTVLAYIRIILNLNPLLKWDGYYLLMDLMNVPNLKAQSANFLKKRLPKKIKNREKITAQEVKLLIYAIMSTTYITYFFGRMIIQRSQEIFYLIISLDLEKITFQSALGIVLFIPLSIFIVQRIYGLFKAIVVFIYNKASNIFKVQKETA